MKHLISINDIDKKFISKIFKRSSEIKNARLKSNQFFSEKLKGKLLITHFFEPSTRTRLSFESAMIYLGGNVIGSENAGEFSSFKKGENLSDNFRVISGYCDIVVGRFKNEGEAYIAAENSLVPVINGGDGKGEHPTQALLDMFTIMEKFPNLNNLTITFIGDNARSRTVHSLAKLIKQFPYVKLIRFINPYGQCLDFVNELKNIDTPNTPDVEIKYDINKEYIADSDVIYITRNQNERGHYIQNYMVFTNDMANMMPEHGIIMHPLPRNSELPLDVDKNPRAYYFEQAQNGLFVRMAILEELLNPCLSD